MSNVSANLAIFGLIGAIIGTVPGILGALITWMKGRDSISKSLKKIELLKAEVDLISAWTEAMSSVVGNDELKVRRESVRVRLDALMQQITEEDIIENSNEIRKIQRAPEKKRKSLAFYIFSGFFFFMIFGASIDDEDNPSSTHLVHELTSSDGATAIIFFSIVWVILLIRWYRSGLKRHNNSVQSIANTSADFTSK